MTRLTREYSKIPDDGLTKLKKEFLKLLKGRTTATFEVYKDDGIDTQKKLKTLHFNTAQKQEIREAATPSITAENDNDFQQKSKQISDIFAKTIRFALIDPLIKLKQHTSFYTTSETDEEKMFRTTHRMRKVLKDILHNYPLMLGDETPDSMASVLNHYEKTLLPLTEQLHDALEKKLGKDAANEALYGKNATPETIRKYEEIGYSLGLDHLRTFKKPEVFDPRKKYDSTPRTTTEQPPEP